MELFSISGEKYYFDIKEISEFVRINDESDVEDLLEKREEGESEGLSYNTLIDITKWEMVKTMVDVLLSDNNIVDEQMGFVGLDKSMSIPSKLSFNTLMIHNLIKKD